MSFQDDKAQYVVPFILSQLRAHYERRPGEPFFIGLNGVQGAGKSVLVEMLQTTLQSPPHNLSTVVFSLDDLYLTHDDQTALARANPKNPLLQHRGQPGTHDVELALATFKRLKQGMPTKIPQYNKAAFSGEGDREREELWRTVNVDSDLPVRVVLFEGWCVGFRPIPEQMLRAKHEDAVSRAQQVTGNYKGRLGHNTAESVLAINQALDRYEDITNQLDAFVHIDAADPLYVYEWRLQQERGLKAKKGSGMTDEQVERFVDGYYPAYELYTESLREGLFRPRDNNVPGQSWEGKQLRFVVGRDRRVREVINI